jgi:hypothetical protein
MWWQVPLLLLAGLAATVRAVASALPALLVVVFAGLLALLALACGPGRRDYALDYADRLIDLASCARRQAPSQPERVRPGQRRTAPADRPTALMGRDSHPVPGLLPWGRGSPLNRQLRWRPGAQRAATVATAGWHGAR